MYFDDFDFVDELLDSLEDMNFTSPTPIQEAAIPPLLEGRDLLGCAQTGTGKTAAFLLPIIDRIARGEFSDEHVTAVIMEPTRELAQQVERQIQGFGYFAGITSQAIYGGTDGIAWAQQSRSTQQGVDIVVATPGRLLDMLNLGAADISHTCYFVIDEADRMLDMGFFEDITNICKHLPKSCQIALFSATMPPKIAALAEQLLKDPFRIELAISKPPETILQCAYICYDTQKIAIVESLFRKQTEKKKAVIFASSKLKVRQLYDTLKRLGLDVAEMHSDLEQAKREQVMRDFKAGFFDLLVATDIVARGIDIDDIDIVVNFDMPHDPEDYVHRIGRTARGISGEGTAISLVGPQEQSDFAALERFLGYEVYKVPLDESFGEVPGYNPTKKPTKNKRRTVFGRRKEDLGKKNKRGGRKKSDNSANKKQ